MVNYWPISLRLLLALLCVIVFACLLGVAKHYLPWVPNFAFVLLNLVAGVAAIRYAFSPQVKTQKTNPETSPLDGIDIIMDSDNMVRIEGVPKELDDTLLHLINNLREALKSYQTFVLFDIPEDQAELWKTDKWTKVKDYWTAPLSMSESLLSQLWVETSRQDSLFAVLSVDSALPPHLTAAVPTENSLPWATTPAVITRRQQQFLAESIYSKYFFLAKHMDGRLLTMINGGIRADLVEVMLRTLQALGHPVHFQMETDKGDM